MAAGTDGERFLMPMRRSSGWGISRSPYAMLWCGPSALNRTLVLPHILGHSGCSNESLCTSTSQEMAAAHSDLFVVRRARGARHRHARVPPARLPSAEASRASIKAVWAYRMNDGYWDQLGVTWHKRQLRCKCRCASLTAQASARVFRWLHPPSVNLAFRSLFAALELGKDGLGYPPPGIGWLNTVAMPNLYRPHPVLSHLADSIVDSMRRGPLGRAGGHARMRRLACTSGWATSSRTASSTRPRASARRWPCVGPLALCHRLLVPAADAAAGRQPRVAVLHEQPPPLGFTEPVRGGRAASSRSTRHQRIRLHCSSPSWSPSTSARSTRLARMRSQGHIWRGAA